MNTKKIFCMINAITTQFRKFVFYNTILVKYLKIILNLRILSKIFEEY